MKCHYEVLNIARDADQGEIKTAYRKLALKWHPDKNLNEPDVAKEYFQLVQQAYEVLSDLQERTWYDNHREEILRGRQANYEDNSLDIFQYFTSSCFKGYDDSPESFYSVYSEVFSKLATEDIEYMDDPEEYESIPIFGNSQSHYDVVRLFYSYWQSYSTKKSYAWLSPYNINETRDRRVVKLIEKENKKVIQKARRERNEQVRQLVQFVRKRDKRVIAQRKIEEERSQQNKNRMEQIRKEQIKLRQQELSAQVNSMQMHDLESQLREIERNLSDCESSSDSEFDLKEDCTNVQNGINNSNNENDTQNINKSKANDTEEILYCVACNKIFKTTSSFENHERSKKHKERVAALLQEMQEGDEESMSQNSDENMSENSESNSEIAQNTSYGDILQYEECSTLNDKAELSENQEELSDIDELLEECIPIKITPKSKTKNKQKSKSKIITTESVELLQDDFKHISSDDENIWDSKIKGKQKKSRTKNKANGTVKNKVTEDTKQNKEQDNIPELKNVEKIDIVDTDHICVTCNQKFTSKNKLFAHLKSSGHGAPLNQNNGIKKEKKSKKR